MGCKRVVFLVSGRGSNLAAVVDTGRREGWAVTFAAAISNRPDAAALALAADRGVPTAVVDHRAFAGREAFDEALAAAIDAHAPDLVVMAGFMRIVGDALVERHAGRMLNVHPSLLPAFPGLDTHRRAIDAGCAVAGATVHYVTPRLDHGPIVAQAAVAVRDGDTPPTLAARVLAAEHRILPLAVGWHLEGALAIDGMRVRQRDGRPQWLWAG